MADLAGMMPWSESAPLFGALAGGDRSARGRLIVGHVALADRVAGVFARRSRTEFVDPDDLRSEARVGLVRAVDGFDPGLGVRFNTYATRYILWCLRTFYDCNRWPVTLAPNDTKTLWAVYRARARAAPGPSPTDAEVMDALGWGPDRRERAAGLLAMSRARWYGTGERDGHRPYLGQLPDRDHSDEPARGADAAAAVAPLLAKLPPDLARQVAQRYGLGGAEPMTLSAIGRLEGVTKERIRQRLTVALKKMAG